MPIKLFDFGCSDKAALLDRVLAAVPGGLICLGLLAGCAALGRLVQRGGQNAAAHVLLGWAIVTGVLTLLAVCLVQPLAMGAWAIFAAMAVALGLAIKQGYFKQPLWRLALYAGLPLLIAINMAGISKWDDFSHWVANALYLYHYNGVPSPSLPAPHSVWPGYPYALPFITALASILAVGFLVQGGAMFNALLLIVFAGLLAEQVFHQRSVSLAGLGFIFLLLTLGDPFFNPSFVMTGQGDAPSMVVVGALALLLWQLIAALKDTNPTAIRQHSIFIALLNMLLVLIKQSDAELLALLHGGFLLVAWKNGVLKKASRCLPVLLGLALLLRFIWQYHLDAAMAGNGFSLRPFSQWRFDLLLPLLQAMGQEALKVSGCFALLFATMLWGGWQLFRPAPRPPTPAGNFALLAGAVCAGHLAFLVFCYLAATFSEEEVRRAASFYRYSTQVGLVSLSAWVLAAAEKWPAGQARLTAIQSRSFCFAGLALLLLCLGCKPTWLIATPTREVCATRAIARQLAAQLPEASALTVIEPEGGDGLFSNIANFELALAALKNNTKASGLSYVEGRFNRFNHESLSMFVAQTLATPRINALFVLGAKEKPVSILGFDNRNGTLLLQKTPQGWNAVNALPSSGSD